MISVDDRGILLKTTPFGESYLLVECFLRAHGLMKGLVRISKKQNGEIIAGNIVEAHWKARLAEQLGYFSFNTIYNTASFTFCDRLKTTIANSVITMMRIILNEREVEKQMYETVDDLLIDLSLDKSKIYLVSKYVDFEIELLNKAGFGLDLKQCAVTKSNCDLFYISPKSGNAVSKEVGKEYHDKLFVLPEYMKNNSKPTSLSEAIKCLEITGFFIKKNILFPYGKKMPKSRLSLIEKISSIYKIDSDIYEINSAFKLF